jgi:PAS domain S-box-containing protein
LTLAVMFLLIRAGHLPLLPRPFVSLHPLHDFIPLFLFLFFLIVLAPRFCRQEPELFSYALTASAIPAIGLELHANFGSTALYDNDFVIAHILKIFAYGFPFVGLISSHVKAYRGNQRALSQMKSVVDNVIEGVIVIDGKGVIRSFNRAAEAIFGYSANEVLRRNVSVLMPEPDRSSHDAYMTRYVQTGQARIVGIGRETVAQKKTGELFPIFLSVGEFRTEEGPMFTGLLRDITKEKQAQDEILRVSAQLQGVLDSATESSIIAVDRCGVIKVFNRGAERMLGYTAEEVINKQTPILFHVASEIEQRGRELSQVFGEPIEGFDVAVEYARRGRYEEREWTHVRKDGTSFTISLVVTALRDSKGEIVGFLGVGRDVTARKVAEEAMRRSKEQAEAVSRLKSEFLANVSHELRTPLNSVIGFANLLLKNKGGRFQPEDIDYLDRIQKGGKHLLELINDVLDLSKIEAGKMELEISPVRLEALIKESIEQLAPQAGDKKLELTAEVPEGLRELPADAIRLKQVMINLIGNALKFTEKGHIRLTVEKDMSTHLPRKLQIVDTGIGIAPDRLEAIFERFTQADGSTKRKYGGSGLGLTLSKSFLGMMGFDLTVTSELGKGTTFTIHFDRPERRRPAKIRTAEQNEEVKEDYAL